MSSKSITTYSILALKGFCMGAANVIPGVSGGTMALILGIYEELINAIHSINLTFFRLIAHLKIKEAFSTISLQFLLPVTFGVILATFSLARSLCWLFDKYPVIVWSFFFGLILSSVFEVSKVIKQWKISTFTAIVSGSVLSYFLFGIIPVNTPDDLWFIFFSGFISVCAMILPGISGAYILVLLGKYRYILEALNNKDFVTLLIVTAGAVVGLLSFIRLIGWLFKKYHDITMALLIGLMLGSLRKIWPWKETVTTLLNSHGNEVHALQTNIIPSCFNKEVFLAIIFMFFGLISVLAMGLWAQKKE